MDQCTLLNVTQITRCLLDDFLKIIDPVIKKNVYFAQPEILLLTLTVDIYISWAYKGVDLQKNTQDQKSTMRRHVCIRKRISSINIKF